MIQSTQARGVQASKCVMRKKKKKFKAANKKTFLRTDIPAGFGKAAEIN